VPGKIKPGDPGISATEFNRHVDASDYVLGNLIQGSPSGGAPIARDVSFVTVKNVSGADRRKGEILEFTDLDDGLTDLEAEELMLKGGSPTLANAFAILREPIADAGRSARAQIAGSCVGLVNVTSSSHRYAGPKSGSYVLESRGSGPLRILWKPGGTGEKTCGLAFAPAAAWYFAVLTSTLDVGDSAGAEIINWNGSSWERSGETITVQDFFQNLTESVPACTKILAFDYQGIIVVGPFYCKPADNISGCSS